MYVHRAAQSKTYWYLLLKIKLDEIEEKPILLWPILTQQMTFFTSTLASMAFLSHGRGLI